MVLDLVVPLKRPILGKSRLRGALGPPISDETHAELVLALAMDTLRAATEAPGVRRVLVVGSDPAALAALRLPGVEVVGEDFGAGTATGHDHDATRCDGERDPASVAAENTTGGLNAALNAGERLLRTDDPHGIVGALQADLPALRPEELSTALAESAGRRAFVADRHGTGTTLLLSAPGRPLAPRFGPGSARAHRGSGALALSAALPSLRGDVDTPGDLRHAHALGLGEHTRALLHRAVLAS